MDAPGNNIVAFAGSLGLTPSGELFVGRRGGFPVGLKVVDPHGAVLLLFQVRHWLLGNAPQLKSLAYEGEVSDLLATKKIEIEFDDRIAWVTMIDLGQTFTSERVGALLDPILKVFGAAGLIGDPELCHYCQKEKVDDLISADGKVAQICPTCLAERDKKLKANTAPAASEAVPIALMTPAAALVGAFLWAACWSLYSKLTEPLDGETVFVPRILLAVAMVLIGLTVGGPVGWLIKQNRRRGGAVSAAAAILFSLLGVFVGEILHLVWLIYREFHVVSFSGAVHVMPDYYLGSGGFFLGMKVFAVVMAVVLAYGIAKPPKATLEL